MPYSCLKIITTLISLCVNNAKHITMPLSLDCFLHSLLTNSRILCFGLSMICISSYGQVTISRSVNSGSDDAEERVSSGLTNINSSDLELISDNNRDQIVGMRFTNILIPQGTSILNSNIEFETDETSTGQTDLTIYGEDIDDAPTFIVGQNNISSRTPTTATINWNSVPPWNIVSEKHFSPDIKSIIQEIINRPNWTSGNDIVIMIKGTGARTAESYDGENTNAPKLKITFSSDEEVCFAIKQDSKGTLYSWTPSGILSSIGILGITEAETMVLNGACNEIYTTDGGDFGIVDMSTGLFTLINDLGKITNPTHGIRDIKDVDGMAIDNLSGYIYATERRAGSNDLLFLIDPTTGMVVKDAFGPGTDYVPIPGPNADIDDLAFNPCTGELFGVSTVSGSTTVSDIIVKIDINTGNTTTVVPLLECDTEGMGFNNSCELYVTTGSNGCISPGTVFKVDLNTGNLSTIVKIGGDVEAVVCCVDAPLPSPLTCTVEQTTPKCNEPTASAEVFPVGGTGGYTFLWSNNATTSVVNNLTTGTYDVTVTDFSQKTTTCKIEIKAYDISCSIIQDFPVTCTGDSDGQATVTAVSGAGGYSYLWDNGETDATAIALDAGLHTVQVTDSENCSTTCSINITEPEEELSCTAIEINAVECKGEENGEATVSPAGGHGGYTYAWDNGEDTARAIALDAGLHTVTVTDEQSCTTTCSVMINEPANDLTCSAVDVNPVICKGQENGEATVTPAGGNGGYSYLWDNNESTATAIALNAGLHTVTVTDNKDCTSACSVTIDEPDDDLTCTASELKPVVCNGDSNGQATVNPSGGNGGFQFNWDNGETTQTANALNGGLHSVTVTDSKGCFTTCTVAITDPEVLTCMVIRENYVACNCKDNGSASADAIGGHGAYVYLWSNGETTQTAVALGIGEHTVIVTDELGCQTTCKILMEQDPSCCSTIKLNGFLMNFGGND